MTEEDIDIDEQELQEYLSLFQDKVKKELQVIDYQDIGHSLYHISMTKVEYLVPNISRRSSLKEDNTVPRICTSTSLVGCISAIANVAHFAVKHNPTEEDKSHYTGGYYIHAAKFRKALKPSKVLVFDVDKTNEHWLVSYNETLKTYPNETLGKFFVVKVSYIPREGRLPVERLTCMMEIDSLDGVWITDKKWLDKGFWCFTLEDGKLLNITPVDSQLYRNNKALSASMLSHESRAIARSQRNFKAFGWLD